MKGKRQHSRDRVSFKLKGKWQQKEKVAFGQKGNDDDGKDRIESAIQKNFLQSHCAAN